VSDLQIFSSEPTTLLQFILNFGVGVLLSWLLGWHFARYGSAFSNRDEFGRIIPFIMLTTLLLITVVKSSLALSLGLVGALSIVRFRTPIKEPEELAYLFIAIGAGVGLGAGHTMFTVLGTGLILVVVTFSRGVSSNQRSKKFYISVEVPDETGEKDLINAITEAIAAHTIYCDLHKISLGEGEAHITYFADFDDHGQANNLLRSITSINPLARVSMVDQRRIPGV